jgi:hypothetical protein
LACFPTDTLRELVGTELKTLRDGKRFTILFLDDTSISLKPAGGYSRDIPLESLTTAWHLLRGGAVLGLAEIRRIEDRHSAYIAAIIARMPGVERTSSPVISIRLKSSW